MPPFVSHNACKSQAVFVSRGGDASYALRKHETLVPVIDVANVNGLRQTAEVAVDGEGVVRTADVDRGIQADLGQRGDNGHTERR